MARKRDSLSSYHAKQNAIARVGKVCIGNASLNVAQVRHIKLCLLAGFTRAELALTYGLAKETIARIDRRETWAHVTVEDEPGQETRVVPVADGLPLPGVVPGSLSEEEVTRKAQESAKRFADRFPHLITKDDLTELEVVPDPFEGL